MQKSKLLIYREGVNTAVGLHRVGAFARLARQAVVNASEKLMFGVVTSDRGAASPSR